MLVILLQIDIGQKQVNEKTSVEIQRVKHKYDCYPSDKQKVRN